MFRRLIVHNNTFSAVSLELEIFPKSNDFINFRAPVSVFNATVRPRSNTCVLSLMKIVPNMAWGDYEVKCQIVQSDRSFGLKANHDNSDKKKGSGFNIMPIDLSNSIRYYTVGGRIPDINLFD